MTLHNLLGTFAIALSGFYLYSKFLGHIGRRPDNLPPGPPTLPIIGNFHQMPKKPELTGPHFETWARQYGPIYSLVIGTQTWIVLNKDEVVRDLLDKRGAIYSSRPDAYLAQDVFSGGMRAFLMKDDKTFKMNRRLGRVYLSEKISKLYIPYQDLESKAMLVGLLEQPELFIDHFRRYAASLATEVIFGFRILTENDPVFRDISDSFDRFSEISFSLAATLLDMFPLLRWLPDFLVPAKRRARAFHKAERQRFLNLYLATKKKTVDGTAIPCFSRYLVQIQEEENLSDYHAAYTSGSLLQGGMGSTAETLTGFMKALMLFPDVPKAAQTELDRVCGARMPELHDWPNLPYIRGCVKESLRWMAASPLGIPHQLTADDVYMGYRLPKGATVICNVRAIHNDATRYPNPLVFDPTRWAHDEQTAAQAATNPDVSQRDHFMFGAGRRICQGIHIAERSLFLVIARLLWGFNFHRAVDPATGHEIPIPGPDHLQGGIFVMPRPFSVNIVPRDATKAGAVRSAWDEAREHCLDENMQWKDVPKVSVV